MTKALNVSPKAYKKMSTQGIKHVKTHYNFENFEKQWVDKIDQVIEEHGSWEDRKLYSKWTIKEVA